MGEARALAQPGQVLGVWAGDGGLLAHLHEADPK